MLPTLRSSLWYVGGPVPGGCEATSSVTVTPVSACVPSVQVPGTDGKVVVFSVKPVADLVVVAISVGPSEIHDPAGNGNLHSRLESFAGPVEPFRFKYEIVVRDCV